jgi:hypothetical protein
MNKEILIELAKLDDRLLEDRLYEIAVEEIERGEFDGVAKARAFEEAEGDDKKSRAYYVKHRVRRIRDLITAAAIEAGLQAAAEEASEVARSKSDRNAKRKNDAQNFVRGTADRLTKIILSSLIFVVSFIFLVKILAVLGLSVILTLGISFIAAAMLASKFTSDKHDNNPKVKKGRSVHSYRGWAIYEIKDGYKTMGAWFRSIDDAQLYIDNNYDSFKNK